ncbi:uncharacterized protein [Palaemon carinicauda]|uniref:uncharacterized protein n=1 Tax=Palaemon carinicauda TaxID=392227 RepID=UPI0035B5BF19
MPSGGRFDCALRQMHIRRRESVVPWTSNIHSRHKAPIDEGELRENLPNPNDLPALQKFLRMERAFDRIKAALAEATTLVYHEYSAPLKLTTDTINVACSAVLEQIVNGYPQPLAFFSKKLKPVKTRYSTFYREVLAVYLAVRHFRRDSPHHRNGPPAPDPRFHEVFRQMVLSPTTTPGSYCRIRLHYQLHLPGKPSFGTPSSCRRKIFDIIYGLSHPSGRTIARFLSEKLIWLGIRKGARERARTCINCQMSKFNRHIESGVSDFPQPKRRFRHIHMDVVGPLPSSGSARYLLTIVDRSTRWLEATPMSEATTPACAEALLSSWISRSSIPDDITMERVSALVRDLALSGQPDENDTLQHHGIQPCSERHGRESSSHTRSSPDDEMYGRILESATPDRSTHFTPKNLDDCDYVFIRVDAHRQPLTRPYGGPYEVFRRTAKSFLFNLHGKEDLVTIDLLKPVCLQSNKKITVGPGRPRIPPQNISTRREKTTQ